MYFSLRYYIRHRCYRSLFSFKSSSQKWKIPFEAHICINNNNNQKCISKYFSNEDTTWAMCSALGKNIKHLVGDREAALTFPLAAELNLANFTN